MTEAINTMLIQPTTVMVASFTAMERLENNFSSFDNPLSILASEAHGKPEEIPERLA
jgi:hypothetical protein